MARIRTIKPEFWSSEQIMECSTNARLLFIGMWNFADDAGRMKFSSKTIKAQVFPGDEITSENVRLMVDELSSNGLLETYAIDGNEYLQITGWHHQKIDKPQKSKHPPKPDGHSSNVRRMVATDLILGNGGEGKEDAAPNGAHPVASTEEAELFRRGKAVMGKNTGGLVKQLLKAKDGSIPLARAAIEVAATKNDPREYVGAIIRGKDPPRGEAVTYVDPRL